MNCGYCLVGLRAHAFITKASRVRLEALRFGFGAVLLAERFELGDVRVVVLGDVRHVQPGGDGRLPGQALDRDNGGGGPRRT